MNGSAANHLTLNSNTSGNSQANVDNQKRRTESTRLARVRAGARANAAANSMPDTAHTKRHCLMSAITIFTPINSTRLAPAHSAIQALPLMAAAVNKGMPLRQV